MLVSAWLTLLLVPATASAGAGHQVHARLHSARPPRALVRRLGKGLLQGRRPQRHHRAGARHGGLHPRLDSGVADLGFVDIPSLVAAGARRRQHPHGGGELPAPALQRVQPQPRRQHHPAEGHGRQGVQRWQREPHPADPPGVHEAERPRSVHAEGREPRSGLAGGRARRAQDPGDRPVRHERDRHQARRARTPRSSTCCSPTTASTSTPTASA